MPDLPDDVVAAAERLTRHAKHAVDETEADAYREDRDARLADYDYTARYRESDDTLVLHPDGWLDDSGTVRMDAVNTDDAVEITLSGPGDADAYRETASANARVVERVREEHGDVHAANARALADFAENHYAKPVWGLTDAEVEEFRVEYFVRNAWPSDEQRDALERSLEHVKNIADDVRTSD